ncbi:MAG: hypothetical protein WC071_14120, partial [Victivallaceae bacterium]
MNHWDIYKIIPLLKECGSIAMSCYANPQIEIKADLSIVTAADKAIEARLAVEFDHPAEGVHLIG